MTITPLSSPLPPTSHRKKKTPKKISVYFFLIFFIFNFYFNLSFFKTKSPIVNMGRQIPSTLEDQLKSRLGEDTQSGETSESESEMVEGRTISTLTTITEETVTAPNATTSSEAIARQISVPGGSNQNDMVDEEPEEEEEDFIPPEEILKQQLMSEFKRNSKFDLRDVEYFVRFYLKIILRSVI